MDPISLAQAGPVAILLVGIGALFVAFVRGTIVPGYLYQDEKANRIKAEIQAERNTDALEAVAATVKAALDDRARREVDRA